MNKETKRRIIILLIGIVGVFSLVIGVSYAMFNSSLASSKEQSIKSGCLKIDMIDSGSITINNAVPMTDDDGLNTIPYNFSITNRCTVDANYITTINIMNTSNKENASKIKVSLSGDSNIDPIIISKLPTEKLFEKVEGVSSTYKLDEGYLKVGESKTFNVYSWIDYDVESFSGSIETKIIVNSIASNN